MEILIGFFFVAIFAVFIVISQPTKPPPEKNPTWRIDYTRFRNCNSDRE